MFPQAVVATLFLSFPLATFISAQTAAVAPVPSIPATGEVDGKIVSKGPSIAAGIRITLHDPATRQLVASTYAQEDGTFALYNIPRGNYDVIAFSDDATATGKVTVSAQPSTVDLQLPARPASPAATDATVSVAHMLVPERAHKVYRKARQEFTQGKCEAALQSVNQALQIDPQFAEALTLRGLIEMHNQDLTSAEASLKQSLQVDPNYSPAYMALAAIYNHQGRFPEAMEVSQKAENLSPRSWQGYFEMARASLATGMYQKALQFARQAERLGGESFAALHLTKAYALVSLRFYKDARQELQAVLTREPKGESAERAKTLLAEIAANEQPTVVGAAH